MLLLSSDVTVKPSNASCRTPHPSYPNALALKLRMKRVRQNHPPGPLSPGVGARLLATWLADGWSWSRLIQGATGLLAKEEDMTAGRFVAERVSEVAPGVA